MVVIDWTVQRGLLVSDLTRQINRASVQVQSARDPLLDHIDTLQRFKRALIRAETEADYTALADEWSSTDQHDFEEI